MSAGSKYATQEPDVISIGKVSAEDSRQGPHVGLLFRENEFVDIPDSQPS
jgi:hypothetical protein